MRVRERDDASWARLGFWITAVRVRLHLLAIWWKQSKLHDWGPIVMLITWDSPPPLPHNAVRFSVPDEVESVWPFHCRQIQTWSRKVAQWHHKKLKPLPTPFQHWDDSKASAEGMSGEISRLSLNKYDLINVNSYCEISKSYLHVEHRWTAKILLKIFFFFYYFRIFCSCTSSHSSCIAIKYEIKTSNLLDNCWNSWALAI